MPITPLISETEKRYGWKRRNGKHAEVCGAETLALLRGLEPAIEFQQAMPEENRKRSGIVLFADNIASVAPITNERSGSSQLISHKFVEMATTFLDENIRANTEVSWVPRHMGIEGNDGAEENSKRIDQTRIRHRNHYNSETSLATRRQCESRMGL